MANTANITGNQDGENGENQSYTIRGRGTISRTKFVKEIREGKHEGAGIYTRNGTKYGRALPNSKKGDNIDPC